MQPTQRPVISVHGGVMDNMHHLFSDNGPVFPPASYHDTTLSAQTAAKMRQRYLSVNADISYIGFHPRYPDLMVAIAGTILYLFNALDGKCLLLVELLSQKFEHLSAADLGPVRVKSACICSDMQHRLIYKPQSAYELPHNDVVVVILFDTEPTVLLMVSIHVSTQYSASVKQISYKHELNEVLSEKYLFTPHNSPKPPLSSQPTKQALNRDQIKMSFVYLVEPCAVAVCHLENMVNNLDIRPVRIAFPGPISVALTPLHGHIIVSSGTRIYFVEIEVKETRSNKTQGKDSMVLSPTVTNVFYFDEAKTYGNIHKISLSNDGTKLLLAFKSHMAVYSLSQYYFGSKPQLRTPLQRQQQQMQMQMPNSASTSYNSRTVISNDIKLLARLHFPEIEPTFTVLVCGKEKADTMASTYPSYVFVDSARLSESKLTRPNLLLKQDTEPSIQLATTLSFTYNQDIEWSPDDNVVVIASINGIGNSIYWDMSQVVDTMEMNGLDAAESPDIDGVIWIPGAVPKCTRFVRKCFKFVPGTAMVVTASSSSLLTYTA